MKRLLIVLSLLALASIGDAQIVQFSGASTGIAHTFTPLHTYFMSPTGSDSNSGTSAGSPWLTPNHAAIVCGDVIIAATGAYSASNLQVTQTPGTCPSTSGGIDGTGGIYAAVVLCAGNVGQCTVNGGGSGRAINIAASYWSIQGWQATNSGNGVAFAQDCTSNTLFHHLSFINDIANNTGAGFSFGTCGGSGSFDYVAVVGNIAQAANHSTACTSAFNPVTPINFDTVAGTHIFFYSNFGIANDGNTGCASDGNGMILDSPDIHSYTQQVVFSNNIIYSSREFGIHIFSQEMTSVAPVVKVYNNTVYNSGTNPVGTNVSEIDQQNTKFAQSTTNNIALTGAASRNSANLYAMILGGINASASSSGNFFKGTSATCGGSPCAGGSFPNSVETFGATYGTNTYGDPTFNNTTDLLANQVGTPACTAFENVAQCMGYNAVTTTLTNPSVIYDLTPSAGGTSGNGFQLPTTTCAPNADFPIWLKGLNYLHWTGSTIQQKAGLASTPCGL
jgi:hypothetical protein